MFKRHCHAFIIGIWTVLHLVISYRRSFWQDEFARLYQYRMTFRESLIDLFAERSPFAPGELILGRVSQFLFDGWMPYEFWMRAPSVLWGSLTLWIGLQMRIPVLGALLFFSASLTSFSTQARPYSALIFSGALLFRMLWDRRPLSRAENCAFWFAAIFGHLYGICFAGVGAFFSKSWNKLAACVIWVAVLLAIYTSVHHGTLSAWNWPLIEPRVIARETLAALSNPYRVGNLCALLVVIYLANLCSKPRKNLGLALGITAYFGLTLAAPLAVTIYSHYFFVPRHLMAAMPGFLVLTALGLDLLLSKFKSRQKFFLQNTFIMGVGVIPWTIFTIFGKPPFTEQPLHRNKDRVEEVIKARDQNVMVLDLGGATDFYFKEKLGPALKTEPISTGGLDFNKSCWSTLCVYSFAQSEYAWLNLAILTDKKEFVAFANGDSPRFDRILYANDQFPLKTEVTLERLW